MHKGHSRSLCRNTPLWWVLSSLQFCPPPNIWFCLISRHYLENKLLLILSQDRTHVSLGSTWYLEHVGNVPCPAFTFTLLAAVTLRWLDVAHDGNRTTWGSHLAPVASSMLILASLVTSGLGRGPVLNGEDPGRRAECHCMAPAASSSCAHLWRVLKLSWNITT